MHRQLAAIARNGLLRRGADDGSADGDDATWMTVDWPSMTRREEIDGRIVNVIDTRGEHATGPPVPPSFVAESRTRIVCPTSAAVS